LYAGGGGKTQKKGKGGRLERGKIGTGVTRKKSSQSWAPFRHRRKPGTNKPGVGKEGGETSFRTKKMPNVGEEKG